MLSQLEHAFTTSPSFSLQKLWFYVHPTLHTLSLLHGLVTELTGLTEEAHSSSSVGDSSDELDPEEQARNEALGLGGAGLKAVLRDIKTGLNGTSDAKDEKVKGGEVLAILHDRMQRLAGDPSALALHKAMIRASGRPYAEMLVAWIRGGKLNDPDKEFCVKETTPTGDLQSDYIDEFWEKRYTVRNWNVL